MDNATLTKLFPISIAISVLSLFSLRDNRSLDVPGFFIFSLMYFLILYIGTHMIASSDELNNADNARSHITINRGNMG